MICPYCGKENDDDAQFCIYCGGSLAALAAEHLSKPTPIEPPISVLQTAAQPAVALTAPSEPSPKVARRIYENKTWWVVGCVVLLCLILGCGAAAWGLYNYTNRLAVLHPATTTPTLPSTATVINSLKITPSLAPSLTPSIVPSIAPSLTYSPTPLSKLTSTPKAASSTRSLIFSDDFSNPASGWDSIDQADFYTDYFNNAYRITVNTKLSDSWANPDDNLFGDVSIEVDATKNGGPDDNDFGVICRYENMDQFYYGVISSDGYYGINKVTSKSSSLIGRDSLEFNTAIKQGTATNHIRFDCKGDVLTLYVNGQQVDQQTDSDYANGNVGLIAGTYDTPGTDILFDNFFVYQP
jgi:hypothetical protein